MFFVEFNFFCRWTSVQVPHTGVRSRLHPAVQPTATPPKPRVPDWAVEEPTFPLQHLWKGIRHREQSEDPHGQGEQRDGDGDENEEMVHHRIVQNVVLFQASNSIWMTIKLLFVFMFALFAVEHGKFDQSREFQLSIKLSEFRPKLVQAFKPIYIQASPKSDPLKSVRNL